MITPLEHLPSLRALCAGDEELLASELRLIADRQQIAIVRTLVDELERCLLRGEDPASAREQVVHELARLGCRSLETAAVMITQSAGDGEPSGIHRVLSSIGPRDVGEAAAREGA